MRAGDRFFFIRSDSPINCLSEIVTKETYFIDKYCGYNAGHRNKEKQKFIEKFFLAGLPESLKKA